VPSGILAHQNIQERVLLFGLVTEGAGIPANVAQTIADEPCEVSQYFRPPVYSGSNLVADSAVVRWSAVSAAGGIIKPSHASTLPYSSGCYV
jgi:hypothetical protein